MVVLGGRVYVRIEVTAGSKYALKIFGIGEIGISSSAVIVWSCLGCSLSI